jgi:hypothetical protein
VSAHRADAALRTIRVDARPLIRPCSTEPQKARTARQVQHAVAQLYGHRQTKQSRRLCTTIAIGQRAFRDIRLLLSGQILAAPVH